MDFFDVVNNRQSCRSYDNKPVPREMLIKIAETAATAPSACNSQPWRFIIADEPEVVGKMPPILQHYGFNKFADDVPAYIVICEGKAKLMKGASVDEQYYAQMDLGIATAILTLSATALGLSSCIIGAFLEPELRELLQIPEDVKPRLVLAVGYAKDDKLRKRARKPSEEIIRVIPS